MTNYVDVFVVPVPERNIEAYRKQAELFAKVRRDHGALSCIEVEADDVKLGNWTSFPQSVDLKPGEKVFVGIFTYARPPRRSQCQGNEGLAHDWR